MFKEQKRHTIDVLFVITLFAVFAISVLALTGVGAKVYQNIVDEMQVNYDSRTSYSYIINKIRQSDANGDIKVGEYGGAHALILTEEIDNISYSTYLYSHDGKLKELFTRSGQEFDLEYGTDILELENFSITEITDTFIKFSITPKGENEEILFVHVRSGE